MSDPLTPISMETQQKKNCSRMGQGTVTKVYVIVLTKRPHFQVGCILSTEIWNLTDVWWRISHHYESSTTSQMSSFLMFRPWWTILHCSIGLFSLVVSCTQLCLVALWNKCIRTGTYEHHSLKTGLRHIENKSVCLFVYPFTLASPVHFCVSTGPSMQHWFHMPDAVWFSLLSGVIQALQRMILLILNSTTA